MAANILEFLNSPEWDFPFFKRLARNDTAQGSGHQAGMVITKDLRPFFPLLDQGNISANQPTTDYSIRAEMFVGLTQVAQGLLRYQFQTWGGTRSPESRITDGFAPIHRRAEEGDLVLFQRSTNAIDSFRVILIRKGTPLASALNSFVGGRPRGPLFLDHAPLTQRDLANAADELKEFAVEPFSVTKPVKRKESHQLRLARSAAFPLLVGSEYQWHCCISRIRIQTPNKIHEVEAAHVVPVSEGGPDDVRNGLSLTRTLHWAFDQGLFGIRHDRKVYVPQRVLKLKENALLQDFNGREILEAQTEKLRVHNDALEWHLKHRVKRWE